VLQNLEASSTRKIGKEMGKTKRLEKDPLRKRRSQTP